MPNKHTRAPSTYFPAPFGSRRDNARTGQALRSESLYNAYEFQCDFIEDFIGDSWTKQEGWGDIYQLAAGGTPTQALIANEANGVYKLALAATNEQEVLAYDWTDQRNIPGNVPWYMWCRVRIAATIAASQRVILGLASAYRAQVNGLAGTTPNITRYAWFRLEANMNLVTELFDGTTRTTLKAPSPETETLVAGTGAANYYEFMISRDQNSDVRFQFSNYRGENLGTVNTIANALDNTTLQPVLLVMKDTGTGVPEIDIDAVACSWDRF